MPPKKRWGLRHSAVVGGSLVGFVAWLSYIPVAQANFRQEILSGTVCSFIATQDVGSTVFVRSGPGKNYPVVATLRRGDGVRATVRQGNWVRIRARSFGNPPNETFRPLEGWVNNQFMNGCAENEFERWRN